MPMLTPKDGISMTTWNLSASTVPIDMSNGRVIWIHPDDSPDAFPNVELAMREPDGLLAAGGDLSPARLLAAYRAGIFPWYEAGQPILWWSPDPRCVLWPKEFHLSRRLAREIRTSKCELRFDTAFGSVIEACAAPRRHQSGTWITTEMQKAFLRLHNDGWAHSIEVWNGADLVGGVYGIAIGRVFFGESMFSRRSNTSKMALAGLAQLMTASDMELIDCQVVSQHLTTLGARTMPRAGFVRLLHKACHGFEPRTNWPRHAIPVAALT
jgi:leucyl/phenylalanyl-tRNA---protein transferase